MDLGCLGSLIGPSRGYMGHTKALFEVMKPRDNVGIEGHKIRIRNYIHSVTEKPI